MSRYRQQPGSSTNVVLIVVGSIVGVLLLVILVCGGLMFFMVNKAFKDMGPQIQAQADLMGASGVAQEFLNSLNLGQVEAAYGSTTAGFQARQTLPQFQAFVAKNPLLTKFNDIQPQDPPINNAPGARQMTFHYTLTGKGATSVTVLVVKEGDDWKIDALTVP
jgi:hypothetical protein